MAENVKYFAVLSNGRSLDNPAGLARRTLTPEGRLDESLRRDLTWVRSSEIYQWERGENFGPDLIEIRADEAAALVEWFRQRWSE